MNTDLIPEGRYLPVKLDKLDVIAHWVLAPDNKPYLAIARQCAELGVGFQAQMAKLAADDAITDDILRSFRIETTGGVQAVKCLRKPEAALWLAGINPAKVKKELRTKMSEVRAQLLMAAERIVFGDMTNVLTVRSTPARGGDLDVGGCPICRTHLGLHAGPDYIGLYPIED